MYYSNSDTTKPMVDSWYKSNITDKGYDPYVSTGIFCEQAKVKNSIDMTSGNVTMDVYTAYTPNFKCSTDGNGKGIINSKVGLITYDEVVHAGGYNGKTNVSYYLVNGNYNIWTMSPAGFSVNNYAYDWFFDYAGIVSVNGVTAERSLRPVINLSSNTLVTGTGEKNNPYVVKTN